MSIMTTIPSLLKRLFDTAASNLRQSFADVREIVAALRSPEGDGQRKLSVNEAHAISEDDATSVAWSMSVAHAAEVLQVTANRVRQRLTSDPPSLYGYKDSTGHWRVLRFQFSEKRRHSAGPRLLPHAEDVIAAIPQGAAPSAVAAFFAAPNAALFGEASSAAMSPFAWLEAGQPPEKVIGLVKSL